MGCQTYLPVAVGHHNPLTLAFPLCLGLCLRSILSKTPSESPEPSSGHDLC